MVVDTSALIALARREPELPRMTGLLEATPSVVSVANILETHMVIARRWPDLVALTDQTIALFQIRPLEVTAGQVEIARAAFDRFGKGMGHPAQLTYGDCFAYALAKAIGAPLLFKGNDFAQTDIEAAIY